MGRESIFMECSFSHRLNKMGCMYVRPAATTLADPDLYFLCQYTCGLLTEKRFAFVMALALQKQMQTGAALREFFEDPAAEGSPIEMEIATGGVTQMAFSASLVLSEKMPFRFGYIGFGYFFGRRKLNICAAQSFYCLLHTLYNLFKQDEQKLERLWQACSVLGGLPLGSALYKGNSGQVALKVYNDILQGAGAPGGA
ncbi:MAG: hypothetical protein ACK5L3_10575 [Oscillospiraceae bacterium]